MKTVLNKKISLTPKDTKTNIEIPFDIEENADKLKISFKYLPKILEDEEKAKQLVKDCILKDADKFADAKEYQNIQEFLPLKNLVTISVYSPDEYIGAAHRHDNEQTIFLSEKISTQGFIPTKISLGEWKIVLNIHCIITDICSCSVEIETTR